MYKIEFQAKIKNGMIEIPKEHKEKLNENVKVTIWAEGEKNKVNFIDKLLNSPLKVANFKPFTREEIYE